MRGIILTAALLTVLGCAGRPVKVITPENDIWTVENAPTGEVTLEEKDGDKITVKKKETSLNPLRPLWGLVKAITGKLVSDTEIAVPID